jgi:hypothetical protein
MLSFITSLCDPKFLRILILPMGAHIYTLERSSKNDESKKASPLKEKSQKIKN